MTRKMKRSLWIVCIPILIILVWVVFMIILCWPGNERELTSALVKVKRVSCFTLSADQSPILYFASLRGDSLLEHPTWNKDSMIMDVDWYYGFWVKPSWAFPFCNGRMIVGMDSVKSHYQHREAIQIVKKEISYLQSMLKMLNGQRDEYRYYLKVHGVKDEGYDVVVKHATITHSRIDTIQHALQLLLKYESSQNLAIERYDKFYAGVNSPKKSIPVGCSVIKYGADGRIALMQTTDKKTPKDIFAISLLPYSDKFGQGVLSLSSGDSLPVPTVLGDYGAPVLTSSGNLVGMKLNRHSVAVKEIFK